MAVVASTPTGVIAGIQQAGSDMDKVMNAVPQRITYKGKTYDARTAKTPEQRAAYLAMVATTQPMALYTVGQQVKAQTFDVDADPSRVKAAEARVQYARAELLKAQAAKRSADRLLETAKRLVQAGHEARGNAHKVTAASIFTLGISNASKSSKAKDQQAAANAKFDEATAKVNEAQDWIEQAEAELKSAEEELVVARKELDEENKRLRAEEEAKRVAELNAQRERLEAERKLREAEEAARREEEERKAAEERKRRAEEYWRQYGTVGPNYGGAAGYGGAYSDPYAYQGGGAYSDPYAYQGNGYQGSGYAQPGAAQWLGEDFQGGGNDLSWGYSPGEVEDTYGGWEFGVDMMRDMGEVVPAVREGAAAPPEWESAWSAHRYYCDGREDCGGMCGAASGRGILGLDAKTIIVTVLSVILAIAPLIIGALSPPPPVGDVVSPPEGTPPPEEPLPESKAGGELLLIAALALMASGS